MWATTRVNPSPREGLATSGEEGTSVRENNFFLDIRIAQAPSALKLFSISLTWISSLTLHYKWKKLSVKYECQKWLECIWNGIVRYW